MRRIAYLLCAVLVGIPTVYASVVSLFLILHLPLPFPFSIDMFLPFRFLIPPMMARWVSSWVVGASGYLMLLLVIRRAWLLIARSELTPASFGRFQTLLGFTGLACFALAWGIIIFSNNDGAGFSAAILFIPAMICIPWAFFLAEIFSFRRGVVKNAA
jgi:hypothetical protein